MREAIAGRAELDAVRHGCFRGSKVDVRRRRGIRAGGDLVVGARRVRLRDDVGVLPAVGDNGLMGKVVLLVVPAGVGCGWWGRGRRELRAKHSERRVE